MLCSQFHTQKRLGIFAVSRDSDLNPVRHKIENSSNMLMQFVSQTINIKVRIRKRITTVIFFNFVNFPPKSHILNRQKFRKPLLTALIKAQI